MLATTITYYNVYNSESPLRIILDTIRTTRCIRYYTSTTRCPPLMYYTVHPQYTALTTIVLQHSSAPAPRTITPVQHVVLH
jgi:hypothetical protein